MQNSTAVGRRASSHARAAARSGWLGWLARFGLLAMGVSYALVAILAVKVAVGDGGKTTDREGAFRTLADETLGRVLLVLLAIGFAGYVAWRLADAFFDRRGEGDDAKGLAKRASSLGKAAIYVALTVSIVRILAGSGGGGGSEQKAAAGVLGWPGGRWLVGAVGVAVLAAAAWNVYRGVARKFEKQLREHEMSSVERRWVTRVAVVGLAGRGAVFAVIAWFLIKAAVEYDPDEAVGLGGALARLADAPYGPVLLGAAAVGLLAFAAFCAAQARYREV
jgi:hypothetical protein